MTRQGSLAYYLAAWVCGCFFMSVTIWLENFSGPAQRSVSGLLFVYFLQLMNGALPAVLFGFLLRRAANRMHWSRALHWLICGAILAPALTALLSAIASSGTLPGSGRRNWIHLSLLASSVYAKPHGMAVLSAPAGAATAWVLFRIDRALGTASRDPAR
jgi:hypothetical protein